MGMVQSKEDVSRPYLVDEVCKGVHVKGVDRVWIRPLCALSRLREIGPMKHRPIPCVSEPVCARSMRAGTFFSGCYFSIGRGRENFKASQTDYFVPVSSGYLKGDWVY